MNQHRVDGWGKVTGATHYTSDLALPGMLHAALVRSPVSRARIKTIDPAAALRQPGVITVVTASEAGSGLFGPFLPDQPTLALGRVEYAGQPIAAVVAESREAAREAAADVAVDLETEESAHSLELALSRRGPRIHESAGGAPWLRAEGWADHNVCHAFVRESGDVEVALRQAPHVFEDIFQVPAVQHFAMEPFTAIARFSDDALEVWSATQSPFVVRRDLALLFRLPTNRVRVVAGEVGGGFGAKLYTKIEPIVAACAMHVHGRPVRLELGAAEWPLTITRHAAWIRLRTAVDGEGRLLARDCLTLLDTGAYADAGPVVTDKAGYRAPGPYRIRNIRSRACAVYTNLPPAGAFRGFGAPQVTFASESQLDMIASRLGLDPVELRRRNLIAPGEPFVIGDRPLDCDLPAALESVVSALSDRPAQPSTGSAARGVGYSCGLKDGGGQVGASNADVRLDRDGTATLFSGAVEMGQGTRAVYTQLVAEELRIPLESVRVVLADTGRVPFDSGTSSSRTVAVAGQAVVAACRSVVAQLRDKFRQECGLSPEVPVELGDEGLEGGGQALALTELMDRVSRFNGDQVVGSGAYRALPAATAFGALTAFWEPGVAGVEVEVDMETGAVKLLRFVGVLDTGRALQPALCEGQHVGATAMALGHALFEELRFDGGLLLNGQPSDYRLPMAGDMPLETRTILVEEGQGPGPHGSKGVAEGGMLPVAAAVGNAIAMATGVRLQVLPMTPEVVWRALRFQSQRNGGVDHT